MFKGSFYQQTKGVPICSPIAGVLAEIAIRSMEKQKVARFQPSLKFYVRYVDNILTIWTEDKEINKLAEEFTVEAYGLILKIEQKTKGEIEYLDIKISMEGRDQVTSIYSSRYTSLCSSPTGPNTR